MSHREHKVLRRTAGTTFLQEFWRKLNALIKYIEYTNLKAEYLFAFSDPRRETAATAAGTAGGSLAFASGKKAAGKTREDYNS